MEATLGTQTELANGINDNHNLMPITNNILFLQSFVCKFRPMKYFCVHFLYQECKLNEVFLHRVINKTDNIV
jgi:hypothetical protein